MKNESPCNQYNCNYVFRYAVFEELLTVMCIVERGETFFKSVQLSFERSVILCSDISIK
jgi:hypothetical protein